jgi:hypothetical protein
VVIPAFSGAECPENDFPLLLLKCRSMYSDDFPERKKKRKEKKDKRKENFK